MLGPNFVGLAALAVAVLVVAVLGAGSEKYKTESDNPNYSEKDKMECNKNCTDLGLPLCRKDGFTWKNRCYIIQDNCISVATNPKIFPPGVDYPGPCRDRSKDTEEEKRKYNIKWPPTQGLGFSGPLYYNASKYLEGFPVEDFRLPKKEAKKDEDKGESTTAPVASKVTTSTTTGSPVVKKQKSTKKKAKKDEDKGESTTAPVASKVTTSTTTGSPVVKKQKKAKKDEDKGKSTAAPVASKVTTSTTTGSPVVKKQTSTKKPTEDGENDANVEQTTTTTMVPAVSTTVKSEQENIVVTKPLSKTIIRPKAAKEMPDIRDFTSLRMQTHKKMDDLKRRMMHPTKPARVSKINQTKLEHDASSQKPNTIKTSSHKPQDQSFAGKIKVYNPNLAKIKLKHKGPECKRKTCDPDENPICTWEGKIYRNRCEFDNAVACDNSSIREYPTFYMCCDDGQNLSGSYKKLCEKFNKCSEGCSQNHAPICADDGNTYESECEFAYASCSGKDIAEKYSGECRDDKKITEVETINTTIVMNQFPPKLCNRTCVNNYKPACDSTGKEYTNICFFIKAQCQNPQLILAPCPNKPTAPKRTLTRLSYEMVPNIYRIKIEPKFAGCDSNCSQVSAPVCGSDCRTYTNLCTYETKLCETKKTFTFVRNGPCEEFGECFEVTRRMLCQKESKCWEQSWLEPVCGTDGNTYKNKCHLEEQACLLDDDTLTVKHTGRCKPTKSFSTKCDNVKCLAPAKCYEGKCICKAPSKLTSQLQLLDQLNINLGICASDGRTYKSVAEMTHNTCLRRQRLDLVHIGPCNSTEIATFASDCSSVSCISNSKCQSFPRDGKRKCSCNLSCKLFRSSLSWICASDGVSYPDTCRMEEASCIKRKPIKFVKKGLCNETTQEPDVEDEEDDTLTTESPIRLVE